MYPIKHNCVLFKWGYKSLRTLTNGPYTTLCTSLKISNSEAEYLCMKHPTIAKLKHHEILDVVKTVNELGFNKKILLKHAQLFSFLPITLKYRFQVLDECGVQDISPDRLVSYLTLVRQRTVKELKRSAILPALLNIENKLASYMTQWPTSLTTLIQGDSNEKTLHQLRLKLIQRYLELALDITEDEFERGLKTYPTIKHRPLSVISESLTLLQSMINIPQSKIKNNFYLAHADPDNIKNIIYKLRSIGGIDIKEIVKSHPKLIMQNYDNMVKMKQVLQEFEISDEAQVRCFEIYTLSPDTVKERLTKAKKIPEFQALFDHPRFLRLVFYNNTAMNRLKVLHRMNKKCLSLSILSGSSSKYQLFKNTPGDRSGKGKDLIYYLHQAFGSQFSTSDIRKVIRRHEFWINIPIVNVKHVYDKLCLDYTSKDIFENCHILLYPWNKITVTLKDIDNKLQNSCTEHIDYAKLNKSQILSLVLYQLEKKHYFTGNGVWTEEKMKTVVNLSL